VNSGTFRLGDQSNLLIHDNQTRKFASMKSGTRHLHKLFSWGTVDGKKDTRITLGTQLVDKQEKISVIGTLAKCRISVVIPSHNRSDLLDQALFTVLAEPYTQLEIIVFDNASQTPIEFVSKYRNNQQVKFYRSDTFLSVTESWNSAISHATGDYLIFLGDDDGLLPGFYSKINQIIEDFEAPDLIMSSLYQFFHPGVLPSNPDGLLTFMELAPGMGSNSTLHLVSPSVARNYVSGSLNTKRHFLFQLPGYVIKRDFLISWRLNNKVFEPPFPDYFLANFLLWQATKIVASPDPISFQGISKKSFGYTLVNGISGNGFKKLNENVSSTQSQLDVSLLPGSLYWNSYIITMERLAKSIGVPFEAKYIQRYRRLRVVEELVSIQNSIREKGLFNLLFQFKIRSAFFSQLNVGEYLFALMVFFLLPIKIFPRLRLSKLVSLFELKWSPTAYVTEQTHVISPFLSDNIDLYRFMQKLRQKSRILH